LRDALRCCCAASASFAICEVRGEYPQKSLAAQPHYPFANFIRRSRDPTSLFGKLLREENSRGPRRALWRRVADIKVAVMPTREQFLAKLEALGVDAVKERIATNQYPSEFRNVAQRWVKRKEAASNTEQLSLARQAKLLAIAALVIAAISMIIAVFSLGASGVFQ
jgi:hypothetical protein